MLPPPVPTSIRSTAGVVIGSPLPGRSFVVGATSKSSTIWGSPSCRIETLAVVPPMSKAMIRSRPDTRPRMPAMSAPAAGPDSTSVTGWRFSASTVASPPLHCMTCRGRDTPRRPNDACMPSRYRLTRGFT